MEFCLETLPPARIVASLLHLAGFQVVAGVVFVGDGDGADVQCLHRLKEVGGVEREHLQHARLRQVVAVFRSPFALRQPDGLPPSAQVVDVARKSLGILHLLAVRCII